MFTPENSITDTQQVCIECTDLQLPAKAVLLNK